MRKNCAQVLDAWNNGRACSPAQSIWTDGVTIYSYSTAIVTGRVRPIVNMTKYSVTTSTHQNAIVRGLGHVEIVDGLPAGVDRQDLIDAAERQAQA